MELIILPAMLVEARKNLPDCQFTEANIATWVPEPSRTLYFANASLQWLPDHKVLFPHLVNQLQSGGILAIQMPNNWNEPTHALMRKVAMSNPFLRYIEQHFYQ